MTHHPLQLDSGWRLCSRPDHELPTRLSSLQPSQETILVIFFCNTSALLTKTLFEHKSGKLQTFGIFCLADSTLVHCRIDILLPLPLGEPHYGPSICRLFFCGSSVIHVLKNLVNHRFGHSQLLEGLTVEFCHANIWEGEPFQRFIHGLQVDPLCGCYCEDIR